MLRHEQIHRHGHVSESVPAGGDHRQDVTVQLKANGREHRVHVPVSSDRGYLQDSILQVITRRGTQGLRLDPLEGILPVDGGHLHYYHAEAAFSSLLMIFDQPVGDTAAVGGESAAHRRDGYAVFNFQAIDFNGLKEGGVFI